MWYIQVRVNGFGNHPDSCSQTERPFEKAVEVSKANPDHDVWVTLFERCRRVLRAGNVVSDNPSIEKFYIYCSPEEQQAWTHGHGL